jgi:HEAT repeat protein
MALAMPRQDMTSCDLSELARALAEIVATGNNAERCLAVQGLGHLDDPVAVETLTASLRDSDPDVRCDAADALVKLNAGSACQRLLDNLREDPDTEAKTQYIKALQSLGADGCAELLSALVTGRGEEHQIAWDDAYSDWDDWLDVQLAAVEALGVLGASQAPAVIEVALNDPDGQDLWPVACTALARLGQPGIDKLQQLLPQASVLNRKRIAGALALTEPGLSGHFLMQLAGDGDVSVRLAAIESAAEAGSDETLALGLGDVAPEVRAAAIAGVRHLDAGVLDKALNDISPVVVIAACKAIESGGKPIAGLALVSRTERSLRTKSPDLITAMLSAAVVTEPRKAGELIEDICSHKHIDAKVRKVCLRAASKLKLPGIVDILGEAIRADEQSVRMEAISALAELAKGDNPRADLAALELAEILAGTKISAPVGEDDQEDDTVVQFVPKMGKQAAGDDGDTTVKLDRDGNELPSTDAFGGDNAEGSSIEETATPEEDPAEQPPQSTLQAIMAVNPDRMQASRTVELEEADLSFLEMTGSLVRRRKLDPEAKLPAHIDVRRLAAGVAGDTGKASLVASLAHAATDRDGVLGDAALSSLARLADHGVDVSEAEDSMALLAAGNDDGRCRQAIPVLGAIATPGALELVRDAASHQSPRVRAAAVKALVNAAVMTEQDRDCAICDPDHQVRFAAVEAMVHANHPDILVHLLDQAKLETGRYKQDVARLLVYLPCEALAALTEWIEGSDANSRYLALEMLPVLLAALAGREEEPDHAIAS